MFNCISSSWCLRWVCGLFVGVVSAKCFRAFFVSWFNPTTLFTKLETLRTKPHVIPKKSDIQADSSQNYSVKRYVSAKRDGS